MPGNCRTVCTVRYGAMSVVGHLSALFGAPPRRYLLISPSSSQQIYSALSSFIFSSSTYSSSGRPFFSPPLPVIAYPSPAVKIN